MARFTSREPWGLLWTKGGARRTSSSAFSSRKDLLTQQTTGIKSIVCFPLPMMPKAWASSQVTRLIIRPPSCTRTLPSSISKQDMALSFCTTQVCHNVLRISHPGSQTGPPSPEVHWRRGSTAAPKKLPLICSFQLTEASASVGLLLMGLSACRTRYSSNAPACCPQMPLHP